MTTKRITSRDVDCPTCGAPKGERCRGSAYSGRAHRAVGYHTARRAYAREVCQPGQPYACGDYHHAGHCVRPAGGESTRGGTSDD